MISRRARLDAALWIALLAGACAAPPPPQPPVTPPPLRPVGVMLTGEEIVDLADLLEMEDRRTLDSARIAQLLTHPTAELRGRAALAAGRIGGRAARPLLMAALSDSSPAVSADAAFALGELADTANVVVYALARLLGTARPDREAAAVEAAAALGKLGTAAAQAAVRQALERFDPAQLPAGIRAPPLGALGRELLLAVWRFPRPESLVDLVLPHLADTDPEVRWRATWALMRMASPRTMARLSGLLTDSDARVRALAARSLRAATVDSAGIRASVSPALLGALRDPDAHVRINAAGALATYADSAFAPALIRLLDDDDGNVRTAVVQALAATGGARAIQALALTTRDPDNRLSVRATALAGLVRAAPDTGLVDASAWITSTDWQTRLYAARALAEAPWTGAAALFHKLARDEDPRVAAAALSSAARSDTAAAAYPLLLEGLGAADVGVRAAAAAGLRRRAGPADLAALLEAYDRAQHDTVNDAALAVVDALAALQRAGTPVDRSFHFRFRPSPDALVRRHAVTAFGPADGWTDTDPVGDRRTPEFYRGVARDLIVPRLAGAPAPRVAIRTAGGEIVLELASVEAPLTVHNFIELIRTGFYPAVDGGLAMTFRWHRVVPNFVIQDGDPRGDGNGGPPWAIRDEINRLRYDRGVLGMALSGPNTGGSQYFITLSAQPHLDGGYTVFGRVVEGMDVVDRVVQDDPILGVRVLR